MLNSIIIRGRFHLTEQENAAREKRETKPMRISTYSRSSVLTLESYVVASLTSAFRI